MKGHVSKDHVHLLVSIPPQVTDLDPYLIAFEAEQMKLQYLAQMAEAGKAIAKLIGEGSITECEGLARYADIAVAQPDDINSTSLYAMAFSKT